MKRLLLIPITVGLIVGYLVSAQTPKPANLTVKAADNTQAVPAETNQNSVATPSPATPKTTATPGVPQAQQEAQATAQQPTVKALTQDSAPAPAPVTVTSVKAANGSSDATSGAYSQWCTLTYSDGTTADKELFGNSFSVDGPKLCNDAFMGQPK